MGKTQKILSIFGTIVFLLLFSITKAEAATGSISISANKSQIVVGNTVTFTVRVSYSGGMVGLQYNASYDSSKLSLVSGSTSGAPVFSSSTKSQTYTYTLRAKQSGTASFSFNATGSTWDGDSEISFAKKSKSVRIITQAELEASYSKNNNLSSLGVEGATLSPTFTPSITSYTVNLPPNTESINVTGSKADYTASVSGLGKQAVEDGNNTIKIVVTAQNGSSKTYTINAIVEELDPINVKVNNNDLTVVRKPKLIEAPNTTFIAQTIKIGENEVPSLYNEKANITLIGLKDKDGNISLYIYDEKNNSYSKYNQNTFHALTLYIEDKEVEDYESIKEIDINENKIKSYTIKDDTFYYFYAINLETGQENLYRYDDEEKTVQKCPISKDGETIIQKEEEDIKIYEYIIIGLLGFIILTYLIILISSIMTRRKRKKLAKITVVEDDETILDQEEPSNFEETDIDQEKEIDNNDIEEEIKEEINITKNDDEIKVTAEEKEKLIKDSEEELQRINKPSDEGSDDIINSINELFSSTEEEKPKKRTKSKKQEKNEIKKEKKKKKDA